MTRPKLPRKSCRKPICCCFKPDDSSKENTSVSLGKDEFSALKYHDVDSLSQKEASKKMEVSQPTFARILASARKKIAGALVKGEGIRIN